MESSLEVIGGGVQLAVTRDVERETAGQFLFDPIRAHVDFAVRTGRVSVRPAPTNGLKRLNSTSARRAQDVANRILLLVGLEVVEIAADVRGEPGGIAAA